MSERKMTLCGRHHAPNWSIYKISSNKSCGVFCCCCWFCGAFFLLLLVGLVWCFFPQNWHLLFYKYDRMTTLGTCGGAALPIRPPCSFEGVKTGYYEGIDLPICYHLLLCCAPKECLHLADWFEEPIFTWYTCQQEVFPWWIPAISCQ